MNLAAKPLAFRQAPGLVLGEQQLFLGGGEFLGHAAVVGGLPVQGAVGKVTGGGKGHAEEGPEHPAEPPLRRGAQQRSARAG